MNEFKLAVWQALTGDTTLVNKLAPNNNPYDPQIPTAKANAIVDAQNAGKMVAPFLTVRIEAEQLAGRTHLTNAFLLVRCYNERDKSFYTINELASRVKQLLDGQRFPVEGYATVEVRWETTTGELPDDAYDLNFRELTFRIQLT